MGMSHGRPVKVEIYFNEGSEVKGAAKRRGFVNLVNVSSYRSELGGKDSGVLGCRLG